MGGSESKENEDAIKKLQAYQRQNQVQQTNYYQNELIPRDMSRPMVNDPWAMRQLAQQNLQNQAVQQLERQPVKLQAIRNDFILEKSTLKLHKVEGQQFDLQFKFESLADHCIVTLYQQVREELIQQGEQVQDVRFIQTREDIPQNLTPYMAGKLQEFHANVNFTHYNRSTMLAKPADSYYPLVIHTKSWFNSDPMTRYSQILYLDLDTGPATLRLLKRKFLTPQGLYVMDEAFGLNSDRRNGEDSKECLVCLTDQKDTLARPCKHVTLCHACAKVVMMGDRKCPLCRQTITDIIPLQM